MKTIFLLTLTAATIWLIEPADAAEITLESAPPVVVKTVPVAGATDVDPGLTELRVTFSKAMQDGSWSWSTWGEENFPETTGAPRYLGDARTCVLPVKLQPNKFYATWLNSDKFQNFTDTNGQAAVPYLLTFFTGAGGAGAAVIERRVNRAVSEFPAGEDLSSPEGACVAWQRANFRRDAAAISRLSLVPIEAKQQEDWFRREEQRAATGLATYLKALEDSKIVVVQTWRDELANVITYLSFPEGKGRHPYSSRCFGLVNGVWKNLGEDRLPDLASAKANFERKKETLWQQFQSLKSKAVSTPASAVPPSPGGDLLNDDQRAVLAWTDRQFRSFFDARTFDGWSDEERAALEGKLIDALNGPRSTEYYQAINTLAAMRSTRALPRLREIASERVDRNNRDRWMAIRALGILGDKESVPDLIHLVYHGNVNTRWWAQISLVRITGKNFAKDWNAWGKWWNDQGGQPAYKAEIIRWWNGQVEPDKLAESLDESDEKFLTSVRGKSAATAAPSSGELALKLRDAAPTTQGIRSNWSAAVAAINANDATNALVSLRQLTPHIQKFCEVFRNTPLEAGAVESLALVGSLGAALERGDQPAVQLALAKMLALGRDMEEQVKAINEPVESASKP
ncbi:MAG: HEAT repeat domain-containing protein [Verrucomicrobiae bacterium]|nr:HEAT repeat domain-containing protein [Verrucomicrobiae bacterium]